MESVLYLTLKENLERVEINIERYRKCMEGLMHGFLHKKNIGNKEYYYASYSEDGKNKTIYIGKEGSKKYCQFLVEQNIWNGHKENINNLKKQEEELRDVVIFLERRNGKR
ncbi:MAG: hypothetical protein ACI4WM_08895 [Erysipelotrichaceae bacterium]